jgi:hypothetical protein
MMTSSPRSSPQRARRRLGVGVGAVGQGVRATAANAGAAARPGPGARTARDRPAAPAPLDQVHSEMAVTPASVAGRVPPVVFPAPLALRGELAVMADRWARRRRSRGTASWHRAEAGRGCRLMWQQWRCARGAQASALDAELPISRQRSRRRISQRRRSSLRRSRVIAAAELEPSSAAACV